MNKPDSTKEQAPPVRRKNGRFAPGHSGNPGGRRGETMKVRRALADGAEGVAQRVLAAALDGDMQAARLVLERVAPALKPQAETVTFDLPEGATPASAAKGILQAVASGAIDAATARELLAATADVARIIEVAELEERIERLEELADGKRT